MRDNNITLVKDFEFRSEKEWLLFFGNNEENLRILENILGVRITARGGRINITGREEDVKLVEKLLDRVYSLIDKGYIVKRRDIEYTLRMLMEGVEVSDSIFEDAIYIGLKKKAIFPKSQNQRIYIEAIRKNDMVFGIGPAGTGKTYLAVAMAISALLSKSVERIIITRPAVEAGEKLGFLPGDLVEKVSPYLRPIYDALFDLIGYDRFEKYMEKGVIEIAPLAFMRGRTLSDAFIILDEAQNTTSEQMKMFLTRMGYGSKAVITGDITQIDLPKNVKSGLVEAIEVLKDIEGIEFVFFNESDVVRHPLIQKIVVAYDKYQNNNSK
ncbi:MAG: PhoH family protein [Thermosulfidibacteraceae bacterium]